MLKTMTRTLPRLFMGDHGGVVNSIFSPIKLKDIYMNESWSMTGEENSEYVPVHSSLDNVSENYNMMMDQAKNYNMFIKKVIKEIMGFAEISYIYDSIETFESYGKTMEVKRSDTLSSISHIEAFVNYAVIIHKSLPDMSKLVEGFEKLLLSSLQSFGMNYIEVDAIKGDLLYMKNVLFCTFF